MKTLAAMTVAVIVSGMTTGKPLIRPFPHEAVSSEAATIHAAGRDQHLLNGAAEQDSFNPISAAVGAGKHGREALMHMIMEYTRGREEKAENKKKRRKERQRILAAKEQATGRTNIAASAPLTNTRQSNAAIPRGQYYESSYESDSESSSSGSSDDSDDED